MNEYSEECLEIFLKKQGQLFDEPVAETLEEAEEFLDDCMAVVEMVLDYLKKHNIGIGEPIEAEELLTDEERNYLQDYLDEIALLPRS